MRHLSAQAPSWAFAHLDSAPPAHSGHGDWGSHSTPHHPGGAEGKGHCLEQALRMGLRRRWGGEALWRTGLDGRFGFSGASSRDQRQESHWSSCRARGPGSSQSKEATGQFRPGQDLEAPWSPQSHGILRKLAPQRPMTAETAAKGLLLRTPSTWGLRCPLPSLTLPCCRPAGC